MKSGIEGWGNGMLGVIIFSASLPATRVAVADFPPLFLTSVRAVIAAIIGSALLMLLRQPLPNRRDLLPFAAMALGVVAGFPLFSALALQHINSAHSLVFIGLLPVATAIFGVMRGGERPRPFFWLFSMLGSATVAGFALSKNADASLLGDSLMVAAIVVCGFGYAEGARLTRSYGGWQVISWALVFSLPVMLAFAVFTLPQTWPPLAAPSWLGLGYVSVFSMMIGFIFWYRGLAAGGTASVGQLQLLQPFFGFALAGLLLKEPVSSEMILATAAVVACVGLARHFA